MNKASWTWPSDSLQKLQGLVRNSQPLMEGALGRQYAGLPIFGSGDGKRLSGGLWVSSPGLSGDYVAYGRGEEKLLDVVDLGDGDETIVFSVEEGNHCSTKCSTVILMAIFKGDKESELLYTSKRMPLTAGDAGLEESTIRDMKEPRLDASGTFRVDKVIGHLFDEMREGSRGVFRTFPHELVHEFVAKPWKGCTTQWKKLSPAKREVIFKAYERMNLTPEGVRMVAGSTARFPTQMWAGCLVVPPDMFEGMRAVAKAGWAPLIPNWQSHHGRLVNGTWGGCTQGRTLRVPGLRVGGAEKKLLSGFDNGFTLHNDYNGSSPANVFPWDIPQGWRDQFLAMCEEVSQWAPIEEDVNFYERVALQTSMLLDVSKAGNLFVWSEEEGGDRLQEYQVIPTIGRGIVTMDIGMVRDHGVHQETWAKKEEFVSA